jgi:hypothetical protein
VPALLTGHCHVVVTSVATLRAMEFERSSIHRRGRVTARFDSVVTLHFVGRFRSESPCGIKIRIEGRFTNESQ